jgi:hypothetical protein
MCVWMHTYAQAKAILRYSLNRDISYFEVVPYPSLSSSKQERTLTTAASLLTANSKTDKQSIISQSRRLIVCDLNRALFLGVEFDER